MARNWVKDAIEERENVYQDIMGSLPPHFRPAHISPRRTTYTVPPPPNLLIVTFVGGPKNSTQEFVEGWWKSGWADGQSRDFIGDTVYSPKREPISEVWRYKIHILPLVETAPFTEAQCAIGVFVP